jgi:hypothetical protein
LEKDILATSFPTRGEERRDSDKKEDAVIACGSLSVAICGDVKITTKKSSKNKNSK